jgi:hypothetical protein
MPRFLAPLWLALCSLYFFPGAGPAVAEDFQQALALSSSIEHDSNLRMSAAKQSVTRTILKPAYTLTNMLGADQFDARLGLGIERSSDRRVSNNREDPNLMLGWQRPLATGELGLTARYEEASAQQTQLQETGLVTTDDTRTSWSLGGRWQTALTERATLATNLDYQNVSYDGGTLTNYENHSASLNLGYAWSETVEPFLLAAASHYKPSRATVATSDSYSLQGGAKVKLADNWEWQFQAGRNRVDARTSDNSWLGNTNLGYTGRRHDLALSAGRSVNSSGEGGFVQSDQLRGTWGYAYDELTRLRLEATWQKSRGLQPNTMRQLGASANRDLSPFWRANLYYSHKQRDESGQPTITGNVVGVTLVYSHPDF